MAKASQEELSFLETFARWWEEAGIFFYGQGTRDQDDGLIAMAEQAKAILEHRVSNEESSTGFEQDRDHAPIDSEIYALLDSIGATYSIRDGIVTVVTKYGDTWNFTEPKQLEVKGNHFP